MKTAAVFGVLWLATLGGAWFLGRESAPKPETSDIDLASEPSSPRKDGDAGSGDALASRPSAGAPALEGVAAPTRPAAAGAPTSGLKRPEVAVVSPDLPLNLEDLKSAEDFLARFFAYAAAHLAGGETDHKELYKAFSGLLEKEALLEPLFGNDEAAMRHLYPTMRFLMDRDAQVVDFTETMLKTAADEPSFFEGEERDEAMEILCEGIGPLLPGVISEQRLERLRGYVKRVLAMPEESLPKPLKGTRREMERLLAYWTPPLSSAEAAARLRTGEFTGREALTLLSRVEPKDRAGLDITAILGPLVQGGDYRAMSEVARLQLDVRELAAMDARLLDGAALQGGSVREWTLIQWLQLTKRGSWNEYRNFVEEGLRRGPPAADVVAMALRQLPGGPSKEDVDTLLRTYRVSERVATTVRQQFGLR